MFVKKKVKLLGETSGAQVLNDVEEKHSPFLGPNTQMAGSTTCSKERLSGIKWQVTEKTTEK